MRSHGGIVNHMDEGGNVEKKVSWGLQQELGNDLACHIGAWLSNRVFTMVHCLPEVCGSVSVLMLPIVELLRWTCRVLRLDVAWISGFCCGVVMQYYIFAQNFSVGLAVDVHGGWRCIHRYFPEALST